MWNGGGSGLGNINLEQHVCQDQLARVSRATVADDGQTSGVSELLGVIGLQFLRTQRFFSTPAR